MLIAFIVGDFTSTITRFVREHPAIHNSFIDRFAIGDVSKEEFVRFAEEFYHFSRHFPLVLCSLLINTPDEKDAEELTIILASELGDGIPRNRHELLYRDFLRSLGIEPAEIIHKPMLATTRQWIDTQLSLYSGQNQSAGLGASFGLETMAIPMWDKLIAGLVIARERWFPRMDMTYFTFHRKLEQGHENAMNAVVDKLPEPQRESFVQGVSQVLNAEEQFWLGLEA